MNTKAVYMVGNGLMSAAYREGDLIQTFGPPYSSPSLFESEFLCDGLERDLPRHRKGSAVWDITLRKDGRPLAAVTDFAMAEEPCLVRHFETEGPLVMRLSPMKAVSAGFHYEEWEQLEGETRVLIKTKNGNAVYNDYPLPFPQFYTLVVRGAADLRQPAPFTYDIQVDGVADMLLIGGPSYPECDRLTEKLCRMETTAMLQETLHWWGELCDGVTVLRQIPDSMPHAEKVRQAVEDTVLNIVVQQSAQGGVMAGFAYHMGYVRDQYGVCMAMLRMGMKDRARRMLQFYIDVFRRNGKILNAQAMGVDGMFHFAENDDSEITGYLLLQFFKYAEMTGDEALLIDHVDFLQWLYERQLSQLYNGTLPFNGDETYIAGGLLPRDVINDGSAEATMLFLLSGDHFAAMLEKYALADPRKIAEMRRILAEVKEGYTDHFVVDGQYTLNDPTRTVGMRLPEYRYGVCMNLGKEGCDFFGWTQLSEGEVYLCPRCRNHRDFPAKRNELFHLPSALLMPAYLDAHLLKDDLVREYLNALMERLQRDGYIYSDEANRKNVGYDYGLLLYNLVKHDLPGKEQVCEKLLSLQDEVGAWSEYYIEDQHAGTRYRPWESGINIDALLLYAECFGGH